MSFITTDQGIVHYEVFGRGRPVILLHGWLGSWGLWQETMTYLGHRDNFVHAMQWQPLKEGVPQASIERFPKAGHFILLDETGVSMHKLKDFLDKETLTA